MSSKYDLAEKVDSRTDGEDVRDFRIVQGQVMGECPKCEQPYMGSFDTESTNEEDWVEFKMECVNCRHQGKFKYHWPDDLPIFYPVAM